MKKIRLPVSGKTLDCPVLEDTHTTREIAKRVTERLEEIANEADRIDTQAFALIAAMTYAHEAHVLRAQAEAETSELLTALDEISKRLRTLESRYASLKDA
jgi:cell division protein ZapA (FtsZ GTPase activity inhibitor)